MDHVYNYSTVIIDHHTIIGEQYSLVQLRKKETGY